MIVNYWNKMKVSCSQIRWFQWFSDMSKRYVPGIYGQDKWYVRFLVAPLWRKANSSKLLISKQNREFLFSCRTQKSAEYDRFRCSKRWSGKGGAKISTEPDSFSLIYNVLRIKKTWMVSYFCPTKNCREMKRNSFNVLFFIKKAKLLKNGEASVCMRITVNGARVETNIRKSIDPASWKKPQGVRPERLYRKCEN